MDWVKIAPLLATLSALSVACLAAALAFGNSELQKARKRNDLYRLLKAEITNLERHCRITSSEIISVKQNCVSAIRVAKYRDGSMLLFDPKEAYLLNENVCQDVMQLSLLSRNDDIFIDELIFAMKNGTVDPASFKENVGHIAARMTRTSRICAMVLDNLEEFSRRPHSYNRPVINW